MGEEVLDTLRKNKGLGWQILGTYDEAIDGVKSGKYYAAIVLGEDFSKNMFDFIDNGLVHPSVTYYENEKKNAVASKITQSGKSTLQENINTQFVDTVVQTAMGSTDGILSEDKDILSGVTESLKKLNSNLSGYNTTITAFVNSNNALQGTLNQVKNEIPQVQQALLDGSDTTQKIHEQTSAAADEYIQKIDELSSLIRQTSKELSEQIHKLIDSVQNNAGTDEIIAGINSAQNLLDALMAQNDTLAEQLKEISQQLGGVVDDEVREIAIRHHEKLDGSGYFRGLKADELTRPQRIVAVADILSALYGKRSYKEAFGPDKIKAIIQSDADNGKICPEVVGVAVKNMKKIIANFEEKKDATLGMYIQIKKQENDIYQQFKGL